MRMVSFLRNNEAMMMCSLPWQAGEEEPGLR
jgi:hypothetical protein